MSGETWKRKATFCPLASPSFDSESFKRLNIRKEQNLAEVKTKARNEGTQEINKPNLRQKRSRM